LKLGFDLYPDFTVGVRVHQVKDLQLQGKDFMGGKKDLVVTVEAKWERVITRGGGWDVFRLVQIFSQERKFDQLFSVAFLEKIFFRSISFSANKLGKWNQGFVLTVPQGTPHLVITVWQDKPYGTNLGEALVPVDRLTVLGRGDLLRKDCSKKM
jgi:hypothetical protein